MNVLYLCQNITVENVDSRECDLKKNITNKLEVVMHRVFTNFTEDFSFNVSLN